MEDFYHQQYQYPKGPKYLTMGYLGLGVVVMVLGRYLIVGYVDLTNKISCCVRMNIITLVCIKIQVFGLGIIFVY